MIDIINIQDTVVLDDDKKYLVVGKALYDGVDYLYLLSTSDYVMEFAALSDNKAILLNKDTDKPLIEILMPLFIKSASTQYTKLFSNNN